MQTAQHTVLFWPRKADHVGRQYFWHAPDTRAHDVQTSARGLKQADTECLGQRRVQIDVSTVEDLAHVRRANGANELHAVMQLVPFAHLQELYELWTVATNEKPYRAEAVADEWNGRHEQVHALSVRQA